MSDYTRILTTKEVCQEMMNAHRDELCVFSGFSAPSGNYLTGNMGEGEMLTEYCFKGCDFPTIGAQTNWEINRSKPYERINETHKYWICVGIKDND